MECKLQLYSGATATIKVNVCRFCGNTVLPKLSIALFTKDGLDRDLPGRISSDVDLPVSREDGLSPYLCRPCMRKFQAAEKFRSIAKSSYEKQGYNKPSPSCGVWQRTKDTSGLEASPHTAQARPLAKRSTLAVVERRLAFHPRENSKILRLQFQYNYSLKTYSVVSGAHN